MSVMTTIPDLAKEWHKGTDTLYALASRDHDPLPVRYLDGDRYGGVLVSEFESWLKRNSKLFSERKRD